MKETLVILSYGGPRIAYASSALTTQLTNDSWIYGTSGRIYIPNFIWAHTAELMRDGKDKYNFEAEVVSNGYNYEAEEVMNCIREEKLESEIMPWAESLVLMETMDAIRAQWDFKYPKENEK
jgi:predicted dehydrogenase